MEETRMRIYHQIETNLQRFGVTSGVYHLPITTKLGARVNRRVAAEGLEKPKAIF